MVADCYTLGAFVGALREIARRGGGAREVLKQVQPLAQRLAASQDLRSRCNRQCDPVQGFGFQLLHEEPDHDLAVAALSWLPGRGTPPHDHGTWGVVVGVEGDEVNTFWKRTDDGAKPGHAVLEKLQEKVFPPDAVIGMPILLAASGGVVAQQSGERVYKAVCVAFMARAAGATWKDPEAKMLDRIAAQEKKLLDRRKAKKS